jgi:hypothetical protein
MPFPPTAPTPAASVELAAAALAALDAERAVVGRVVEAERDCEPIVGFHLDEVAEWKDRCRDLQECLDNRRIFIEKIENAFADEETTEGEEEINDYDTWYAAHINKMSQRCMDILTEKSRVREEEGVNLSEILGVMKLAADTLAKPADMNVNVA